MKVNKAEHQKEFVEYLKRTCKNLQKKEKKNEKMNKKYIKKE